MLPFVCDLKFRQKFEGVLVKLLFWLDVFGFLYKFNPDNAQKFYFFSVMFRSGYDVCCQRRLLELFGIGAWSFFFLPFFGTIHLQTNKEHYFLTLF